MASIFTCFNAYLYVRLVSSVRDHVIVSFGVMACLLISIIYSNYNFRFARDFDVMTIVIYCFVGILLITIFGYIQTNVNTEMAEEAKLHTRQQDEFKEMFDNLQEAVIMLNAQATQIDFTNEVARELLKALMNIVDIASNVDANTGRVAVTLPIDRMVFYLFEVTDDHGKKKQRRKATENSSAAGTSTVSGGSMGKDLFSLREIAKLDYS